MNLRPRLHTDMLVTVAVALFVTVGALVALVRGEGPGRYDALPFVILVLTCGALHFRTTHPVAVGVLTLVGTAAYYLLSATDGPLLLVFAVALYAVAAAGHLLVAVVLAVLALGGVGFGSLHKANPPIDGISLVLMTGWLVAAVAIGVVSRQRAAYLREAEERVAGEERLRIARELHDVLGHTLSVINVQAAAALHRLERDPAQGAEALRTIKDTSREALTEVRAALGVLRERGEAAPTRPAPEPSLARLPELAERAERSGLTLRTESVGEARVLPAGIDAAAFRIVQESVTNTIRHARARAVLVRVEYGERGLTLCVRDDGVARPPVRQGDGSGIRGMRARAEEAGGTFSAGRDSQGGFRVEAALPYDGERLTA
ncbi:sensor histidine kinase [Streptomyces sp. NPDC050844]|uniref:sensor histidine kinase n=1 Tax=Streptomyces sp. NPDC050844 TaxID=3155790 RepID=UPI0033C4782B